LLYSTDCRPIWMNIPWRLPDPLPDSRQAAFAKSGFKTSDQVQGFRLPAGLRF
jgi:hypothetical protein